jgi:acyl-CoA thioesterase FadM
VVEEVPIEEDSNDQTPVPASRQVATGGLSEYVDGSWFVHVFKATYSDTNSVGNVYFGMYPMWVGKTRELFFNHCMPAFDLKNTHYLILTRSFEHKFIRESREFDQISVKIRVKSFNRKFVTLEHIILDGSKELLGKGTQTLLFVSAASYKLLDIPEEVHIGFLPFRS